MSEPPDHDDSIEEVAADWLTERAEGFSSARKRDFERWCRAHPRHAAAVARLEAACALLEQLPRVRAELQPVVTFPVQARAVVAARVLPVRRVFLAMAAAVALAAFGWWQWPRPPASVQLYATSAGGYERVVLVDGSVIELNANSEVRVDLRPGERRVALVRGESHFTVAHDASRPFVVSALGVAVRAVGTAFNVRLGSNGVEVLVTEGKVAVSELVPPSVPRVASTLLVANERTVIPAIAASPVRPAAAAMAAVPIVETIAPDAVREALSWQERRLIFSETPLREVVAKFNRRNRLQLVLGDAAVAERPVGGTFAADNVEGFVRLLESSGTIAVERRDEMTLVLRTAR
ncbi:FecR family protein [Horticoccus sp. 23ND18S-11]|uniref:FecR family protein n=1 Tax=Horticoccus sp. 23ND18S-11 TaxID=3391832 RepID=UPI0039C9EB48